MDDNSLVKTYKVQTQVDLLLRLHVVRHSISLRLQVAFHEQLLAQRYPVDTKRRNAQRELRSQKRLEKAQEREKPLGLCRQGQDLEGGCFFWHRNDGRGLRGRFPHGRGVSLDPQKKMLLGENRSGKVDPQGLQQQGECKNQYSSSVGDNLKEDRRQFQQTKWLSLIQKDYGFLLSLRGYFSVSFKLPPLNLLYQIFPIKQIESY